MSDVQRILLLALQAHQAGDLPRAEQGYRSVLAAQPAQFDALQLLAAVLAQLGRPAESLALFDRALKLNARHPVVLNNRGNVLADLGRLDEARESYQRALQLAPDYADARCHLGNVLLRQGRAQEALQGYSEVLAGAPGHLGARCNRAQAWLALGRPEPAVVDLDACLAAQPAWLEALSLRADALSRSGRHAEAAADFARLMALRPQDAALAIQHANALLAAGQGAAALAACDALLQAHGPSAEAWNLRGCVHSRLLQSEAALADYQRALALAPGFPLALSNLGRGLMAVQRHAEAIRCFDQLLAAQPGDALAHFSRACSRMVQGELVQGWAEFEWRRRLPGGFDLARARARPLWLGQAGIAGRTVLVAAEQGYGDAIQFSRFLPRLAALGARVLFELRAPLDPLLRQIDGVTEFVAAGSAPPPHDWVCPLMSLGRALRLDWPQISGVPYLRADPDRVAAWQARLGPARPGRRRIGLVWSGNPGHVNDHERSIGLARLLPWLDPAQEWISVQKTLAPGDAALLAGAPQLRSFDHDIVDFADSAALLECLDLLITVDGGVAHLAGALGRPVWILLPYFTDWRWQLDRRDTPWYGSARLFRQPAPGDWGPVLAALSAELRATAPG